MLRGSLVVFALVTIGCGGATVHGGGEGGGLEVAGCDPSSAASPFISCVLSFEPGPGAGFGEDAFPDVIYGPPKGAGTAQGGLDVLSLGKGGEIAFGFGGTAIVDQPGADFVVFENAFLIGGDPNNVYAEPGEVSVSDDAKTWITFPCQKDTPPYAGCAGVHAVISNPANGVSPFDPKAGGDTFDLADIGVNHARYVRIRDLAEDGAAPTAGFDLDAAAILHRQDP